MTLFLSPFLSLCFCCSSSRRDSIFQLVEETSITRYVRSNVIFLLRGHLSTPCKVDTPATLQHSLRVLGGGRSELKWSHRLRECLPAQRHPPLSSSCSSFFFSSSPALRLAPICISILLPEKKTPSVESSSIEASSTTKSGVNLILTPLYHQDVSHGRGHSCPVNVTCIIPSS